MRDRNERLVLTILRRQGSLPKAEIARTTGLSAQTVSVIMRALESEGLLEKGEKVRGKVGQPSVPMCLSRDGALFFGVKVGRRSAELVLVNFLGEILERRRLTYDYPTPDGTVSFVRNSVAEVSKTLTRVQRSRIAGLGIATPYFLWEWGPLIGVDEAELQQWKGFDLRVEIEKLFDFPVYLGNDATCACSSELVFGRDDKPKDFLYIYVGYFIGGGVVLNGSLYEGHSGNAGALGPYPIDGQGGRTRQLIDVASLMGLERRLIDAEGDAKRIWEDPDTWIIDDAIIDDWLSDAVPAIAQTIQAANAFFDFPVVIIDGSMPAEVRERIVGRVRGSLEDLNFSGLTMPRVVNGSIGTDARPLGGASLPLSKRFFLEV
ncbi:MAG: ROK family transcriptional regulator [Paracoccaceae bacterium]|nr:ROK family transcriptional regulator [Paracoccaceae bacterium]